MGGVVDAFSGSIQLKNGKVSARTGVIPLRLAYPASRAPFTNWSHSRSELPPRRGLEDRTKTFLFMGDFNFNQRVK
jgi:hypothetical protein